MTSLRGEAPAVDVADRTAGAVARLHEVVAAGRWGALEWDRPGPSAAFSRRDQRARGFARAVDSVRRKGFEAFIRPVGGRLACYHDGSLVLDLLVRCADPRPGTTARFRVLADTVAVGLRNLGVDARTGAVTDEYCPGEWSVNAGGLTKLVGTGQRLVRGAVLLTAVVVVGDPEPLAGAMVEAYDHLNLAFDPATVGSVSQSVPGVTLSDVEDAIGAAFARHLSLSGPDLVAGRQLLAAWDPR